MQPPREVQPDPAAFERIVEEYADRIYGVALRITGSPAEAEDIMQETFLAAYQNWATFRGQATRATWLYRIAVNAALMRVRGQRPVASLEETGFEASSVVDWSADLDRLIELKELQEVLERGISRLPEDYRVVVILRDVEGLTAAEAAEVLGLSAAALKSRLHRARVLLRQYLSDYLRGQ